MSAHDNSYKNLIDRQTAKLIFRWCVENLGKSKHADTNNLKLWMHRGMRYMGFTSIPEPHRPIIYVNPNLHKTLKDYVDTIIHEYVHHLQPLKRSYKKLFKIYTYDNHPFEKEAELIAETYAPICMQWVLNELKSLDN